MSSVKAIVAGQRDLSCRAEISKLDQVEAVFCGPDHVSSVPTDVDKHQEAVVAIPSLTAVVP